MSCVRGGRARPGNRIVWRLSVAPTKGAAAAQMNRRNGPTTSSLRLGRRSCLAAACADGRGGGGGGCMERSPLRRTCDLEPERRPALSVSVAAFEAHTADLRH